MSHIEGTFVGSGGFNLYYQAWHPDKEIKAIIAIVHGLGGHSGLFTNAVQDLVSQNYAAYAFDLRGHGRSPGQRGHINSWAEFREDLHTFLIRIQEQAPTCAFFLWGHSLGATIALDFALRFPESLQGLILTAPALGKVKVPPLKVVLGRMLSRVYPRFTLKVGIKQGTSSRDPQVIAANAQDPLRHEYGTARLATEFFTTERWVAKHASTLEVPLLILHGSKDKVAPPEGSLAFFQQVTFVDKERYLYQGDYHDLHQDINYNVMLTDLENWLEKHLEKVTSRVSQCQIKTPSLQSSPLKIELRSQESASTIQIGYSDL
ncbi:alpha/beta hydrolase fold protein [Calothrix sp. NIES-4101]|nr:alpha/beta hydrolase fold protein [Calothrix sp. NIES-4101]